MSFFEWFAEIFGKEKDIVCYESGLKLMDNEDFTKAAFEFAEAIKVKPTEEKYHDAYGKTLYKKGMKREADAAFEIADDLKGIAKDPSNAKILCRLAMGFQNKRMFSVSQRYIKRAIAVDPANYQVFFLLGRANYLMNKPQGAIEQYEKTLEINPYCYDAYIGLRDVYNALGNKAKQTASEELAMLVKNVDKSSKDSVARTNLGDAFRKYKKNKLAEVEYNEAIKLNEKSEKAFLGLGILHFSKHELPAAIKYFQKAISMNKYNPEPHSYLCLIYQMDPEAKNEADWERTLATKLKELEQCDDKAKVYSSVEDFFLEDNDLDATEEAYLKALQINSSNPDTHVKLALLYGSKKENKEAMDYSEQAIKLAPDKDIGYTGKGRVLMGMEQLDEAILCFQEALKYSAKNPDIHKFLGEAYKKKGLYQLADKEIRIMGTIQSGVEEVI